MVSASDAIATCPMKLARRQAKVLGLQVIAAPFLNDRITVLCGPARGGSIPGADWFAEQVRQAVAELVLQTYADAKSPRP